eukprot:COSAG06_NODE_3199_length_5697_cov_6.906752_8_plen_54_part_00
MSVPSLSWQNDGIFSIKWRKKTRCLTCGRASQWLPPVVMVAVLPSCEKTHLSF